MGKTHMVKICSALEKRLSAIALVILVIQPALDVLSYFLEQTGSNAISTVARFLMLAAVALLGAGGDKFGTRLWWDVKTDKPAW